MLQQAIDFRDECAALFEILDPLSGADWSRETQFKHWTNLPEKFKFEDVVSKNLVPRSSLHYLTKRAEEAGFLEQGKDDVWRKVA